MGAVKHFILHASPMSKMFMAIALTTVLVAGRKYFYAPYVNKQRYRRAEAWADCIIEQEESLGENGASQYEQH